MSRAIVIGSGGAGITATVSEALREAKLSDKVQIIDPETGGDFKEPVYLDLYNTAARSIAETLFEPIEFRDSRPRADRHGRHTSVKPRNTVGRNDPCPCGSGSKYKKCCYGSRD